MKNQTGDAYVEVNCVSHSISMNEPHGYSWRVTVIDGAGFHELRGEGRVPGMLSANRPRNVPKNAVPFVGWISIDGELAHEWSPTGCVVGTGKVRNMIELGFPVEQEPREPHGE